MWHEVDPTNLGQLQQVVDVLKAHDLSWPSGQALQEWMQARTVRLFYYQGPDYELVVAFEHFDTDDEWRLRTGGARGNLVQASGEQMAAKIVEFMHGEGLAELGMYSQIRSPLDPSEYLLEMGLQLVREHPDVAEVRSRVASIGRRYDIVLR